MNDLVVAWIRTFVPVVVGLVIAWLAQFGIEIDGDALALVFDGAVIGVWYAISRWLESVAPWFPWNGVRSVPTYKAAA